MMYTKQQLLEPKKQIKQTLKTWTKKMPSSLFHQLLSFLSMSLPDSLLSPRSFLFFPPSTYNHLAHQPLFTMAPWAFDFTDRFGPIGDRTVLIEKQLTEITDHKFAQRHVLALARYMDNGEEIMLKIRHE